MRILILFALLLLSGTVVAQRHFRPYAGLHGSGDAELYYLGPSMQLGADYHFSNRLGLTAYGHYFRRRIDWESDDYEFTKAKFDCLTGALLVEVRLGQKPTRGMFVGAGMAVQHLDDDFESDWTRFHVTRLNVLPAIRIGYSFPVGKHLLTAELNATGPHSEEDEYGRLTELITQLSLGTRFVW